MADCAMGARYVVWTLIGAILATIGLVSPGQATNLKDIRIGEYAEYTRVVFEFDKPIDQVDQIVQTNSRMTVMFPEAEPDLVRKIPFQRSKRINNLQIWVENKKLSVVFLFEFAVSRYESFRMRDPFRIALDIYPQTGPVVDSKASIDEKNQEPISNSEIETLITMNSSGKAAPLQNQPASPIASSSLKHENSGPTLASEDSGLGLQSRCPTRATVPNLLIMALCYHGPSHPIRITPRWHPLIDQRRHQKAQLPHSNIILSSPWLSSPSLF